MVRWEGSGQPILVCYIRKYVIIWGIFPLTSPNQNIGGDVSPASPAGLTPVAMRYIDCYLGLYVSHIVYKIFCTFVDTLLWKIH